MMQAPDPEQAARRWHELAREVMIDQARRVATNRGTGLSDLEERELTHRWKDWDHEDPGKREESILVMERLLRELLPPDLGDEWLNLDLLMERLTRGDRVGAAAYLSTRGPFAHVHPERCFPVVDAIAQSLHEDWVKRAGRSLHGVDPSSPPTEAERRAAQDLPESWRVGGTIDDHGERTPPVWQDPVRDISNWIRQMAEHDVPTGERNAVVVVPQQLADAIPDLEERLNEQARRWGFAGVDLRTHGPDFEEEARRVYAADGEFTVEGEHTVGEHLDSLEDFKTWCEGVLQGMNDRFAVLEAHMHEPIDIAGVVDRKLEVYDAHVDANLQANVEHIVARKIDEFESRVEGVFKQVAHDTAQAVVEKRYSADEAQARQFVREELQRVFQPQHDDTLHKVIRDLASDEYRRMTNDPAYREWVHLMVEEEAKRATRNTDIRVRTVENDLRNIVRSVVREEVSGLGDMISQAFLGNHGV